ncbi:hypothetical protein PFTANZ_06566, partial [Plasmodium falciparum Tanzania (2000708)]
NKYSTAGKYINEKAYIDDCNVSGQNNFDENNSAGKENEKYAFKHPPNGYEQACKCNQNIKPPAAQKKKVDCNGIKTLLDESNGGKNRINGCNPKDQGAPYPGWDCKPSTFKDNQEGPCMPPRRQKLCINDLKVLTNTSSESDLKRAFINCAAKEIHFLWKKYKDDKKKEVTTGGKREETDKLQSQLETGKIPDDFKRIMFYTFGDYRDLCLGNDLGNAHDTKNISGTVTSILSTKNGGTEITPDNWWKKIEKEVWDGMLCALSYDIDEKTMDSNVLEKLMNPSYSNTYEIVKFSDNTTTLEDFAERHQFLRWYIEWSDEFCKERKKKENEVEKKCKNDYEGCSEKTKNGNTCRKACKDYEEYISNKKEEYEKQEKNFETEKRQNKRGYTDFSSENGSEYLKEKCFNDTCNCMDKVKSIDDYWKKPNKTGNWE